MTILQLMNAKYSAICEVPADVTGTVQCVEHTCRRADKCQIGIIIGRIITHGCLDCADIDLSLFGGNFYGCGSAILQCQDYFVVSPCTARRSGQDDPSQLRKFR